MQHLRKTQGEGRLWLTSSSLMITARSKLQPNVGAEIPTAGCSAQGLAVEAVGVTVVPEPSFRVWIASTGRMSNFSTRPLGQRTCTESIFVAAPRPKCTRMSLLEMKLEPLRTSSTKRRAPAFTVIFALMPSRLDLNSRDGEEKEVPIARKAIQ